MTSFAGKVLDSGWGVCANIPAIGTNTGQLTDGASAAGRRDDPQHTGDSTQQLTGVGLPRVILSAANVGTEA